MDEVNSAMESLKVGLSLFSESIGLVKKAKDILPDAQDKHAIEKSLEEASKAAKLAEAQIAQALGYQLCKCTFPPQVMLSQGYKESNYSHSEEFKCPKCNMSSIPPPSKPIQYSSWNDP